VAEKSFGKTVLGWFVVQEGEEQAETPSPEALIAAYADPLTPPPVELKGALPRVETTTSTVDFATIYQAAQMGGEEIQRVERASALLQTLPEETPANVKKQIVEASLKAFGVPVDQIIEAGVQQIQALEAYIRHGERETQDVLSQGSSRVEELRSEIEEIKRVMETQIAAQRSLTQLSNEEKLRVQKVLEFFGQEAVARVVKDSPKLMEPS